MLLAAQAGLWRGVEQAMAAKKVRLRVRRDGVVRIAGTDEAELVRVVAARVLHREPVLVRLTNVAAVRPRRAIDAAQEIFENLVSGELVVG